MTHSTKLPHVCLQRYMYFISICWVTIFYNIASRAAQSNSVYVSVLKIPIVHADSVSKSLRQKFFFRASGHQVSAGENNLLRDNNGYKQRLGPPVPKRRQFSDLFPWARVLKFWQKKRKTTEKETRHQRRHDSWLLRTITSDIVVRFSRRIWCKIPPAML